MSNLSVILTIAALCIATLVFGLWPNLDIAVAASFHQSGAFWGASLWARSYRAFFYWLPFVVLAYALLVWALKQRGRALPGSDWFTGRGLAFMALTMALGPGLLVNAGLKDHWHRPRPAQIEEFGGPMQFRPIWRGDGACATNCAFVSGEVSASAWLIAPAMLAPPPLRVPAVATALVMTALTALGRMAFGGHFLSDAIFALLLTLLVVQVCYRWFFSGRGRT